MTSTEQILSPEFLEWLTETFSSFAPIASLVFIAFVVWGALRGLRRSLFRQLVNLAVTLVIAIITFSCTAGICDTILNTLKSMTPEELIVTVNAYVEPSGIKLSPASVELLNVLDTATIGYVIALFVNTIIAPLVFAILFAVVAFVGKIVSGIVCWFVPKGDSSAFKILGLVGGIVEGIIIAGIVLLPLIGWVNITGEAVDTIKDKADTDDTDLGEVVEFYDEIVAPLENHVVFELVESLGGENMLADLATVDVDGYDKDLRLEFNAIIELIFNVSKLSEIDPLELSKSDKDVIEDIIENCDYSVIVTRLLCDVVNYVGEGVVDGTLPVEVDEHFRPLLIEAATILTDEKTNSSTLYDNLTTVANVYFILSDEGALAVFKRENSDTSDFFLILLEANDNGETPLNKVIDEFDKNKNTRDIIPLVSKFAVTMLCESLGLPEGVEEAYETIKTSVHDILSLDVENMTETEMKESVSQTLDEAIHNLGFTISDSGEEGTVRQEDVDGLVDTIVERHEEIKTKLEDKNIDPENMSDADILNFILEFVNQQ